jgi:serine/threonine-protein kinase
MVIPERRMVGKYQILRKLGRGGMADVYLALDPEYQRTVAIKVIEQGPDADSRETIEAERRGSQLQAKLAEIDSRVVRIFDAADMDGYFVVAMEYVEGHDLSDLMRSGPASADDAVDIALAICQTLEHAHTLEVTIDGKDCRGIVHGDIKPKNIRIDGENRVRVLDFGIAKALSLSRKLTRNEFGSVPYASPERLDSGDVNSMSDLWSLGVLLYELVAALSGGVYRAPGAHDPLAHPGAPGARPLPGAAAPHPAQEHGSRTGAPLSVRRRSGLGPGGVSGRHAGPRGSGRRHTR